MLKLFKCAFMVSMLIVCWILINQENKRMIRKETEIRRKKEEYYGKEGEPHIQKVNIFVSNVNTNFVKTVAFCKNKVICLLVIVRVTSCGRMQIRHLFLLCIIFLFVPLYFIVWQFSCFFNVRVHSLELLSQWFITGEWAVLETLPLETRQKTVNV